MSTPRRVLGTGPTTTTRSTSSLRLLPAERVELAADDERLAVAVERPEPDRKGRRKLGPRSRSGERVVAD